MKEPFILNLDTSSKKFILAVSNGEKVLASSQTKPGKVLSDSIIPLVDKILKKAGVKLKGLNAFAIGLGPGSFTSLRVGVSTVKALSLATGKPVIGIPDPVDDTEVSAEMSNCPIV